MEQDSSQSETVKGQERIQDAKKEIPVKHEGKKSTVRVNQTNCQIDCLFSILGHSEFS